MTALVLLSTLVTALCIGYHVGRHAGSTPLTWKKRTSRARLARLAASLTLLMIARRIQQGYLRGLTGAASGRGLKFVEPLQLLRVSLPRRRFR